MPRDANRVGAGLEQAGKLFFRTGQALLTFDLVADIEQGAGHAQRVALCVAVQPGTAFDVAHSAVFQLDLVGDLIVTGRAFAKAAVGLAHGAAILLRNSVEKRFKRLMKRHWLQAMQLGCTCRTVEHAAGDMQVPGAQLCGVQGQVQAFLAVLEGLFGAPAFASVDEGTEQVDRAFKLDVLGAENAVVDFAVAGTKLYFQADWAAVATGGFEYRIALLRIGPQA
ncbi:hypothetical protein D3C72_1600820 [compost metagenome]